MKKEKYDSTGFHILTTREKIGIWTVSIVGTILWYFMIILILDQ